MNFDTDMWVDFSDYELATLAHAYGMGDDLVWTEHLALDNRGFIETLLTYFELDLAAAECV